MGIMVVDNPKAKEIPPPSGVAGQVMVPPLSGRGQIQAGGACLGSFDRPSNGQVLEYTNPDPGKPAFGADPPS
jgi:hypothetical protein